MNTSRIRRTLIAAAAVAPLVALAPISAGARVPAASAARSCNITKVAQRLGPTYVTSLQATGTGCGAAISLVRAFHRCRVAHGGRRGYCRQRVLGYRCTEKRGGIPTQFSGKVTCRHGKATVIHTYTQFT